MQSLWMLVASFVFAGMGVCVKLASELYSTTEIIMYRGLIGAVLLYAAIRIRGGTLRTTMAREHITRGAVGVSSLWMWFYAIAALPLSTAMTLNYMSPIWIALIVFGVAWRRGGQQVEWKLLTAIASSFVGVTLLLQPAFHSQQLGPALVALLSGMVTALAYLQVRRMGLLGEPEYRVVFYFSLVNLIFGAAGNLVTGSAWHSHHTAYGLALLLGIGVSATVAQVAMTRAYRLGKTLVVANLQYTGIVFSSVWGVLLFGDAFDWHAWAGMALILLSGSAATFYNTRSSVRAAADASAPDAGDTASKA